MRYWPFALAALTSLCGCVHADALRAALGPGHSPGAVRGALPDASFVEERGALWVQAPEGVVHVRLDGGDRRLAYPRMHLLDQAPGAAALALSDARLNLYLADSNAAPVRVPAVDGRTRLAVFSPDGRTLAVTRYPDTTRPVAEWSGTQDDTVVLIDVATLRARTLAPTRRALPLDVAWSLDGTSLWIDLSTTPSTTQRIDVATGARQEIASIPSAPLRGTGPRFDRRAHCVATGAELRRHGDGGDGGLDLVEPGGEARAVVLVDGRVRVHHGEHDTEDTIGGFSFTPSCRYAVFVFGTDQVWIADTRSRVVGPLAPGSAAVADESASP